MKIARSSIASEKIIFNLIEFIKIKVQIIQAIFKKKLKRIEILLRGHKVALSILDKAIFLSYKITPKKKLKQEISKLWPDQRIYSDDYYLSKDKANKRINKRVIVFIKDDLKEKGDLIILYPKTKGYA